MASSSPPRKKSKPHHVNMSTVNTTVNGRSRIVWSLKASTKGSTFIFCTLCAVDLSIAEGGANKATCHNCSSQRHCALASSLADQQTITSTLAITTVELHYSLNGRAFCSRAICTCGMTFLKCQWSRSSCVLWCGRVNLVKYLLSLLLGLLCSYM